VLVESFRPGVLDRLGLGWDVLREAHAGLVYCPITGYGQDGPISNRAGHDLNYLARAGVLAFTGPEDGPPQVPGVQIADVGGGAMFAVVGVLSALLGRQNSGQGSLVDISMCEGALAFAVYGFTCRFGGLTLPRGADVLMGGLAPYNTYTTQDGGAVSIGSLEPKFWAAFCAGVGIEAEMSALMPGPQQVEWKQKLTEIFAGKTKAQWAAFAEQHDCCLEVVLTVEEAVNDPQHVARGVWVDRPTGGGGTIKHLRTPAAPPAEGMAPKQGEHSRQVLADAGLTEDEITALADAGVTRQA
jgi:crotonobetainyl-CoA:carnitine CoA-transferase CaiB-like acyl-CoA transferase